MIRASKSARPYAAVIHHLGEMAGWGDSQTNTTSEAGFDAGNNRRRPMALKIVKNDCTVCGACEAECPKEISLTNIARLNRELIRAGFTYEK